MEKELKVEPAKEVKDDAEKEKEAQAEDMKKAIAEDEASKKKLEKPVGKFSEIRRYRGIGALVLKTARGEVKVFSGDVYALVEEEKAKPGSIVVFTEGQFLSLSGLQVADLPDSVEYRALRIGEERRAKAAPKKEAAPKEKEEPKSLQEAQTEANDASKGGDKLAQEKLAAEITQGGFKK